MSFIIPPLLPDELLYSLPGRMLRSYPALGATGVRMVFGGNFPSSKAFPCGLESLAKVLTYKPAPTGRELAYHHTFFPFVAPFLKRQSTDRLLESLLNESRLAKAPKVFSHRLATGDATLRGCRQCIADDIAAYGTAYWHRLHQVPALRICHKHLTSLVSSRVGLGEFSTFTCIDESVLTEPIQEQAPLGIQKLLSTAYEAMARSDQPLPDRDQLNHTVHSALASARIIDGSALPEELVTRALFKEHGASALAEVSMTTDEMIRPDIQAIISQRIGSGRRPNPVLVIICAALCRVPFGTLLKNALGCTIPRIDRTTAIRTNAGPIKKATGSSVRRHLPPPPPPPWLNELRILWPDRKHTWESLEMAIGQPRMKIKYHAAKLRLPNMPRRKLTRMRVHALGIREKRIDATTRWNKREAEFAAFRKKHPDATPITLIKENYNLYNWVKARAPELLQSLPRKQTLDTCHCAQYSAFDEFDREAAELIRRIGPPAREKLLLSHYRITRTRLLGAMIRRIAIREEPRPVHTLKAIAELVESRQQHFDRLFSKMCESLRSGDCPRHIDRVVKNAHLSWYYLNIENCRVRIREALTDVRLATAMHVETKLVA